MITFTRTVLGDEAADGTFGVSTITTITGDGIFVTGEPQEYEAAGLTIHSGPTLLFTPTDYLLRAFTAEFLLPGDVVDINDDLFTVTALLKVVAPDGYVIIARVALGK